jgi:hypothetical protein
MKTSELLTEGLAHDRAEQIIEKFVDFCQEHLDIDELPEINLITGAAGRNSHIFIGVKI